MVTDDDFLAGFHAKLRRQANEWILMGLDECGRDHDNPNYGKNCFEFSYEPRQNAAGELLSDDGRTEKEVLAAIHELTGNERW